MFFRVLHRRVYERMGYKVSTKQIYVLTYWPAHPQRHDFILIRYK